MVVRVVGLLIVEDTPLDEQLQVMVEMLHRHVLLRDAHMHTRQHKAHQLARMHN